MHTKMQRAYEIATRKLQDATSASAYIGTRAGRVGCYIQRGAGNNGLRVRWYLGNGHIAADQLAKALESVCSEQE